MFGLFSKRKHDPASDIFDHLASQLKAGGLIVKPGVIHPRYEHNYILFTAGYLPGVICGMCKAVVVRKGTGSQSETEQRTQLIRLWSDMVARLFGEKMGEWMAMGGLRLLMPLGAGGAMDAEFTRGVLDGGNEALMVLSGKKPSKSCLDRGPS